MRTLYTLLCFLLLAASANAAVNANRFVAVVDTVADLKTLNPNELHAHEGLIFVRGNQSVNDGRGGVYRVDLSSGAQADGYRVVDFTGSNSNSDDRAILMEHSADVIAGEKQVAIGYSRDFRLDATATLLTDSNGDFLTDSNGDILTDPITLKLISKDDDGAGTDGTAWEIPLQTEDFKINFNAIFPNLTSSKPLVLNSTNKVVAQDIDHDTQLSGVSADDHHPQSHGHTGGDSSGTVDHADIVNVLTGQHHAKYTDTEAQTAINNDVDHSSTASHDHDDLSGVSTSDHHTKTTSLDHDTEITGVSASDHHSKYTDAEAETAINNDGDHGTTASHNYYTDEQSQDAWNSMQGAGSHTGISYTYDDAGNAFSAAVTLGTLISPDEIADAGDPDGAGLGLLYSATTNFDWVDLETDTEATTHENDSDAHHTKTVDTTDDTVQDTELSGGNATTDDLAEGATNKYDDDNVVGDVDNTEIGEDISLANGGTGASLVDPNADRILFWDDSGGAVEWLTPGSNLTITGNTLDASTGGGVKQTVSWGANFVDATEGDHAMANGISESSVTGNPTPRTSYPVTQAGTLTDVAIITENDLSANGTTTQFEVFKNGASLVTPVLLNATSAAGGVDTYTISVSVAAGDTLGIEYETDGGTDPASTLISGTIE